MNLRRTPVTRDGTTNPCPTCSNELPDSCYCDVCSNSVSAPPTFNEAWEELRRAWKDLGLALWGAFSLPDAMLVVVILIFSYLAWSFFGGV